MAWYQVDEIFPGVYRVEEGGFVAFFLLQGSERSVIIDTGCGLRDVRALARNYLSGDILVVNTHVHPDHSNGNAYFDAISMGRIEWEEHGRKWNGNTHRIHSGDWQPSAIFEGSGFEHLLPSDFDRRAYDLFVARGIPEPVRLWEDGDYIDLGDRQLEVLHTPAHTRGSICLLDRERATMYMGDTLNKSKNWWLHLKCRASPDVIFATYERLEGYADELDYLLPAHGEAILPGHFLRDVAEGMAVIRSGAIRPKEVRNFGGAGYFYDFGAYGPVFAEPVPVET